MTEEHKHQRRDAWLAWYNQRYESVHNSMVIAKICMSPIEYADEMLAEFDKRFTEGVK